MSGQIAEFWASLGFKVDPAELKKVDKFLGDAEKRLKGSSKKKTEESKATDKVTKAVKGEVAAKAASVKADVAATKAINKKASATRRLTAAEREAQRVGARLRSTPFMNTATQQRINSMFPAMTGGVLGARSQDRRQLQMFYRGAFDRAGKGGVGIRNPAAVEIEALGRIGRNSPSFGNTGRVADLIRQRRVQPEASALRNLGMNNPRFKPLGSAFRAYDEKLDQAVARTRAQGAERQRMKHLALAEQRMSHLGPTTRSTEMRSMSDFYKKQGREALQLARQEAKLKKEGMRSEESIERARRRGVISERRARRAERLRAVTPTAQTRPSVAMASYGRSPANHSSGNFLRAGGAGGAFARYGVGSLPFIGGAYGFATLNRSNQEAITTRLTTQAVLQGQGYTEEQGVEAFDWLRDLGNEIGFSYMDASQDYNQFLANSLGAGMDLEGSQGIFKGLSEYQTAMGTTSYRRRLINNALSQMMGKGVLSMEEVRRQMAK